LTKIAINTRSLLSNKLDGIGWFTYQVVKRWVESNPNVHFYFLFDRPYDASFIFGKNVTPIVVSPPARHPFLWYIWYEWMIPRELGKINPDIFISLDTYTSTRWQGRKITAIHDIAFALFDGQVGSLTEKFLRYFTPKYIQCSEKIVTVSHSTKKDLEDFYNCPESKIIVSNNAASEVYKPMSAENIFQFKLDNTLGCDYFIFVGSIHPRKNVVNLLKAFEIYKRKSKNKTKLILIGRIWSYNEMTDYLRSMAFKDEVIIIPHSTPEVVAQWVASSIALLMVSVYEGFGVPIIEAMACGVPVICSNVSSMPEVAGNAAIFVSPNNIEEVSNALTEIENNSILRIGLSEKAIIHSKKYNWEDAAEVIWEAIK
jgi:glycosyltransferase involved in cell wall biosynthesis